MQNEQVSSLMMYTARVALTILRTWVFLIGPLTRKNGMESPSEKEAKMGRTV